MKLRDSILSCIAYLKLHNIQNPRLESEILHSYILNLERWQLISQDNLVLSPQQTNLLNILRKRKMSDEPTAYLLESKEFYSRDFFVNNTVLIPRPETEELVELILDEESCKKKSLLDLCTGSGCIGITLVLEEQVQEVTFTDYSKEALLVCKKNYHSLCTNKDKLQSSFVNSNLLDSPYFHNKNYDVVVSNPPYVTEDEYQNLMLPVKNYEPKLALVPMEPMQAFFERLFSQVYDHLMTGGIFFLETNPLHIDLQADMLSQKGFQEVSIIEDLSKKNRFIRAQKNNIEENICLKYQNQ